MQVDDIHRQFFVFHKKMILIYHSLKVQDEVDELHVKIF